MNPPTVDACIFDVGNVLIEIDWNQAFRHWAGCAGVAPESLAPRFRTDSAYEAHERGELTSARYFAALRNSLNIDIADADFETGWCAIFRGVFPGTAELLASLAATMPVYLFSNTNALHYEEWRADYPEIIAPVTRVFCSQEIGLRKPSIASFERVCSQIARPPAHIAFFDDLEDNVAGAKRAGLIGFHVATPPLLQEVVTRALARNISDTGLRTPCP